MGFSNDDLAALTRSFERHGFRELSLDVGGTHFELSAGADTEDAPDPTAPASPLVEVRAPSVGIVRLAPPASAAPFVAVDASVVAGNTVCMLEVADSVVTVESEVDGVVRAVYAEDGAFVEYGDPLFSLERSAAVDG